MEMTELDSRTPAENGAWLHLKHPKTGALMWDGDKPCRVLVRGAESRTAIKATSALLRKRKTVDIADIEENAARNIAMVAPLIVAFENMTRDGKPMVVPGDAEFFLGLNMPLGTGNPDQVAIIDQINDFSRLRMDAQGNALPS